MVERRYYVGPCMISIIVLITEQTGYQAGLSIQESTKYINSAKYIIMPNSSVIREPTATNTRIKSCLSRPGRRLAVDMLYTRALLFLCCYAIAVHISRTILTICL